MTTSYFSLQLLENNEPKKTFSLRGLLEASLGRAEENTIPIPDERCSRFHAKLTFATTQQSTTRHTATPSEGQWFLVDLGSRNGTFLENQRLTPNVPVALVSGNQILVGQTRLRFEASFPRIETTVIPVMEENVERHSGMMGIEKEVLKGPATDIHGTSKIWHRKGHSKMFRVNAGLTQNANIATRSGYGAMSLCRLAYHLGKAEEIAQIAKIAIEGLLKATDAEGVALWLFPYTLQSTQSASDIRLVANATLEDQQYAPISETLVKTVIEQSEAFLFQEEKNMIAAPIRWKNSVLGLLHLYTITKTKRFDESDLEYTLAVADIAGVALANLNAQKELTAHLQQARNDNSSLREMLHLNSEIIGSNESILKLHHLISRAAEAKTPLLIQGESGVGKELIARAVHFSSARKACPFLCLNCAALSESLLASELFGHEKGAFTGATERKMGKFEAAHSGTLFLDEIGEMSAALQAKILRVLEGGTLERVGSNKTIKVDVRVLAATNRNLEQEVAAGRFRHDLFFRLRVLEMTVPPLRERVSDIPVLAEYFLERFRQETGRKCQGFSPRAMEILKQYHWPGNVRELKNVVERAVVLGSDSWIQEQDLLLSTLNPTTHGAKTPSQRQEIFIPLSLESMEKNHILRTLEQFEWHKSAAAKQLGIDRTTLDRKIKRFGLERDNTEGET